MNGGRSLADQLRERTHRLHVTAERSGIMRDLLRGQATAFGHALLLRNLLPAYERLEEGLEQHRSSPGVRAIVRPAVYRSDALRSDLEGLYGGDWSRDLPLLAEGASYARRIAAAARGNGARLMGHAYTRYLGDLNGGQILKRLLSQSLALPACKLSFYDFPEIADLEGFKTSYREAIDSAATEIDDVSGVIEEAAAAFQHNIEVSRAVRDAVTQSGERIPV